jgi:nucleoside-diphosphate-sugar epimerase
MILVTGGTGFIGSHLVERLAAKGRAGELARLAPKMHRDDGLTLSPQAPDKPSRDAPREESDAMGR